MMKRFLTILCFGLCTSLFAQQEESYTQYIYNQYALNPAYGGTKACADVKFGTRLQWVGFDGAPITSFFSYNTSIGFKDRTSKSWHGIGAYIVNDQTGFYRSTGINGSYAFHTRMSHRLVASAGIFVGLKNLASGSAGGNTDPLINPVSRIIFPDIGAGLLLYNPEWFIGLSMKQVYANTMSTTSASGNIDNPYSFRSRQYYFTAARWVEASYLMFSYTPSIHIKYHESVMPSIDMSIIFHYFENKFNLGANYRVGEGFAAVVQFNLLKKLHVGYAYEYPVSRINKGTRQTHEIIFKWDPCWSTNEHFGGVNCPSF